MYTKEEVRFAKMVKKRLKQEKNNEAKRGQYSKVFLDSMGTTECGKNK